jgi:hypothetical protein
MWVTRWFEMRESACSARCLTRRRLRLPDRPHKAPTAPVQRRRPCHPASQRAPLSATQRIERPGPLGESRAVRPLASADLFVSKCCTVIPWESSGVLLFRKKDCAIEIASARADARDTYSSLNHNMAGSVCLLGAFTEGAIERVCYPQPGDTSTGRLAASERTWAGRLPTTQAKLPQLP